MADSRQLIMSALNFDFNATSGLDARVKAELANLDLGLNPSSIHTAGQRAKVLIEEAREELRLAVGAAKEDRIIFTSGATESNNAAILSPFWEPLSRKELNYNVVTCAVEHAAVIEPCLRLKRLGFEARSVAPIEGAIDAISILECCDSSTKLVSLMIANNETGIVHDLGQICRKVKELYPKIIFHADCVQALGKMNFSFSELGLDCASFSAHKAGGLTGIGALTVKKGVPFESFMLGGPHEARGRAGTENVPGIVSFGLACKYLRQELQQRIDSMQSIREWIENEIKSGIEDCRINFESNPRLCNTISLTLSGVPADDLLVALDRDGILVSSGAACSSGKPEPSRVLMAYGLDHEAARSTLRISFGPSTQMQHALKFVSSLKAAVSRMRAR